MKFLYKILLCTIIIMAVAFGFSGYLFVNFVFESALEREVEQALDGNNILRFAFETAALNIPSKYNVLQDTAVRQIGTRLESSGQNTSRYLRLSNEANEILYAATRLSGGYGPSAADRTGHQSLGNHLPSGPLFRTYGGDGQCSG